ncbi:hypothetical protein [Microbacterium sp. YY-01]|uniref:hypothetical protein n=1 Tax=Microbacterium sp. YY-01 TaxID=3421634 RepID=UPI003D17B7DD
MMTKLTTFFVPANELPNPIPDWDFLGLNAALSLYNGLWAIVLVAAGIGVLTAALLLIFGKTSQSNRLHVAGLWTLGLSLIAAMIGAGAGAIVDFGANLTL